MLLERLEKRGLILLGGKGGVGKTTLAATVAAGLAQRGRRVCLVSTDPAHNLGHLFERPVGPQPVRIAPNLTAIELDPDETVTAHLAQVGGFLASVLPRGGKAEIERHLQRSRHAPGMAEAAILERLATLAEGIGQDHDHLVLDTAPTGHTLTLLSLPEVMTAWTDGMIANRVEADRFAARARDMVTGRPAEDPRAAAIRDVLNQRRDRFARLRARITDPAATAFVAVTTPERMPLLETQALGRALAAADIPLSAIILNRVPADWSQAQLESRIASLLAEWTTLPFLRVDNSASEPAGIAALETLAGQIMPLTGR